MISILDYGAGNTNSVIRMIEKVGGRARRVSSSDDVLASEKLLIPGVGAFDHGMNMLHEKGLVDALNKVALEKKIPVLGICLGMQLMCNRSDEGDRPGLGWIDADVTRFLSATTPSLRVPHMGWNTVSIQKNSQLIPRTDIENRFYFVHSYKVCCHNASDVLTMTHYGQDFVSSFQRHNLYGVQFHPEKSHSFGMKLFRNFLEVKLA